MQNDHPEQQWIKDYQRGDLGALERLVEHFRRPLFAYILNLQQGQGDPEEIFQEVWLRAIQHLPAYRDRNFAGWLFRIARNLFIDRVRMEQRRAEPPPGPDTGGQGDWIERWPDSRPSPDGIVADRDLGRRIQDALQELPPDQREIFLLRSEADMPFKEIARLLNISINTALARMRYALNKLRPLLIEDYRLLHRD
ncbi:MAG TPA: sigma-70 family RNA polymerase sigma factor [Kiritimatiellia bacterium]|nr:sigma-70 family RNA polymerase sigma factor [Kiritimatiellia bacterium]